MLPLHSIVSPHLVQVIYINTASNKLNNLFEVSH